MAASVSRFRIVGAILRKDLLQFSRERIYMALSIVGLFMFIGVYWIVPDSVDEEVTIGVYLGGSPELTALFAEVTGEEDFAEEGLRIVLFGSESDLRAAIAGSREVRPADDGAVQSVDADTGTDTDTDTDESHVERSEQSVPVVGLSVPPTFLFDVASGRPSSVELFVNDRTPQEVRHAMQSLVRELAFMLAGAELPVREPAAEEIVLGTDRMGRQVTMQERMRPLLAFFVLMMETFALASLIATEISHKTIVAVVATPARLGDMLAAKSIHGVGLALGQALVLLAAIGAFTAGNWYVLILASLMGAMMFTGIAMAVGSAGRDFIGTLFLTMACILPLAIPAFAALFPGGAAPWVRVVPSYGIMRVLIDVTAYEAGFGDVAGALGMALVWLVAIFGLGLLILSRKVARL